MKAEACATSATMGWPSEATVTPTAAEMYVSVIEVASPIRCFNWSKSASVIVALIINPMFSVESD